MIEWISIKFDRPPRMREVLLFSDNDIYIGWDECVQPEEDPSFVSYDHDFDSDCVTHWMYLPEKPGKL